MTRPRLLVVEDDPAILEGLQEDLSAEYHVTLAENVADALALLGAEPFHLVLLDLGLPLRPGDLEQQALAGLEVVLPWIRERRLRQAGSERALPVVVFTARGEDPQVVIDALGERQANHFLRKPVDPEVLLTKVREVLLGEGGVDPAGSGALRIRLALDRVRKRVLLERIPHSSGLEGANYKFLEVLATAATHDREEYLPAQELLKDLKLTSLTTIRRRVQKIRAFVEGAFVQHRQRSIAPQGGAPHPFLETSPDKRQPGYRLNPRCVEVVDPNDL